MRKLALVALVLALPACSSRLESASDQAVRLPDQDGTRETAARAPTAWVAAASHEAHAAADVELAYYTVHVPSARASETLSRRLRDWAFANAAALEQSARDSAAESDSVELPRFSLKVACDPKLVHSDLLSIVCAVDTYQGGSHGTTAMEAFNYAIDGDDARAIGLDDAFLNAKTGRAEVSDICTTELASQGAMWITDGDVTDLRETVDTFHFEKRALVVHFAPEVVGPYAEGEHAVEIPLAKLHGVRPALAARLAQ
jgi:hypothetical protein